MANGHGGVRPNSGRKPKRDKYATAISRAEKKIADRLPRLIDKAFELSEGVPLVQGSDEVKLVVQMLQQCCANPEQMEKAQSIIDRLQTFYSTGPDFKAIQYLIDRIMGKPIAKQVLTGEDGEALKVQIEIPGRLEELLKLDDTELARMHSEALNSVTGSQSK